MEENKEVRDEKEELIDVIRNATDELARHEGDNKLKYGKRYSTELKMLAVLLRAQNQSYEDIGAKLNVSSGSVHAWVNGQDIDFDGYTELAETLKRNLPNKNIILADRFMNAALGADLTGMSVPAIMTSLGISLTKKAEMEGSMASQGVINLNILTNQNDKAEQTIVDIEGEARELNKELALLKEEGESPGNE